MINKNLDKQKHSLPIYKHENEIVQMVSNSSSNSVILVGETGCGKTTQVPQILYDHFKSSICITQPRRVAAI